MKKCSMAVCNRRFVNFERNMCFSSLSSKAHSASLSSNCSKCNYTYPEVFLAIAIINLGFGYNETFASLESN